MPGGRTLLGCLLVPPEPIGPAGLRRSSPIDCGPTSSSRPRTAASSCPLACSSRSRCRPTPPTRIGPSAEDNNLLDCVLWYLRGVDFLASRPEVRADRIVVSGASRSGPLAVIAVVRRPRTSAACRPSCIRRRASVGPTNPGICPGPPRRPQFRRRRSGQAAGGDGGVCRSGEPCAGCYLPDLVWLAARRHALAAAGHRGDVSPLPVEVETHQPRCPWASVQRRDAKARRGTAGPADSRWRHQSEQHAEGPLKDCPMTPWCKLPACGRKWHRKLEVYATCISNAATCTTSSAAGGGLERKKK